MACHHGRQNSLRRATPAKPQGDYGHPPAIRRETVVELFLELMKQTGIIYLFFLAVCAAGVGLCYLAGWLINLFFKDKNA
jgi:hypothetical protein